VPAGLELVADSRVTSTAFPDALVSHRPEPRVHLPWLVLGAVVLWNLVTLRAETLAVPYLDDSSLHEQMVRFATLQLRTGHLPLTSWFPYLGLGSPQFLHYQSLPAMLTGVAGMAVGPDTAFRWSLYLLLAAGPISVYLGARLFAISRWAAAAASALSPFLMSVVGVGYEQKAYLWIGYGVWTQLWASITLPLAWGLSWRAIRDGRGFFLAAAAVLLTIAFHFETGYLALIPLLLWPLLSWKTIAVRVRHALILIGGALLASAWIIVPLIAARSYAATNEILRGTPLENGYGAGRVLTWLVSGQLLDAGRIPIVTILAGIGLALACRRWRRDETGRALVVALGACLVLSFGRTTFGPLVGLVPGSSDIFFRRFMMGAQLAGVLLAGIGAAWCGRIGWIGLRDATARWWRRPRRVHDRVLPTMAVAAAGLGLLAPAWSQLLAFDRHNATVIRAQRVADKIEGKQLDRLIGIVKQRGGGRIYAGMPSNWGMKFTVGAVPVFKYLESRDVDEVGYTLRTASLMTDPEFYFDERNQGDYRLFGVRFLLLPRRRIAPVRARRTECAGTYCLWEIRSSGYVGVGRIVGALYANRSNVGVRSIFVLRSALPGDAAYLRVDPGGGSRRPLRLWRVPTSFSPGLVTQQASDLEHGKSFAEVRMNSAGVVVLSASFDPGWAAQVDGLRAKVYTVSPALPAVDVPAGTHTVAFRYAGFRHYLGLVVVCGLSLALLALVDLRPRDGI
jgi:hypothetical protein